MSNVHIFSYPWQPFTKFHFMDMVIRHKPRSLYRCDECRDRRQARNLEVQAYYDGWRIRCKAGKHPGWF